MYIFIDDLKSLTDLYSMFHQWLKFVYMCK